MRIQLKKIQMSIILFILLGILLITFLYPTVTSLLGISFLSFVVLCFVIYKKYKEANVDSNFWHGTLLCNIGVEIIGFLLTVTLATFLSWHIVEFTTHYFNHSITELFTGIAIGLIVGVVIGVWSKRIVYHLLRTSYSH